MTATQTEQKAKEIILNSKGQDWYDENIQSMHTWGGGAIGGEQTDYLTVKLKNSLKMDFKNTSQNPYLEQIKQAFT